MSFSHFGVYLIPPPSLLYPVGLAHQLLASEFNARTAGRFMVHCTVKGFFKLAAGATVADFLPALDSLFERTEAFSTAVSDLWATPDGTWGAGIALLLARSPEFQALHEGVWEVVRPYIAPDCRFSALEGAGSNFRPHLTLGMADLPTEPGLFEQSVALSRYLYASLPREAFKAQSMQLIEFFSDDWDGQWWDSLQYRQLKGWQLKAGPQETGFSQ